MDRDSDWDPRKAEANLRKHGVSFLEARSAFSDGFALTVPDRRHSAAEDREVTIGWSDRRRLLTVSHTKRDVAIRIISARMATRHERRSYER